MAVKKIVTVPDPVLRKRSKPIKKIDSKVERLVRDLFETAKVQNEPRSVGLSAVQIGRPVRVFVVLLEGRFIELINPEITRQSKQKISQKAVDGKRFMEGCLSIPGYYALVDRPYSVKLKWQNLKGKTFERKFAGRQSVFLQHEFDHLNGILFVDRALKQRQKIYRVEKGKSGKETMVEVTL